MRSVIAVSRYIVGVLFIFSGLVKANDPLGLAYKMQEFFDVWTQSGFLPGLMAVLYDHALAFSIVMIAFEIIAGVAVIIGWRMKLISWLLLVLILFFTFLTGYADLSGKFKSCGCFGDCIPLTPRMSFLKDIFLFVLILLIFTWRNKIKSPLSYKTGILVIFLTTVFSFAVQNYTLKHLPVADCLPFKKGNNILEKMQIPSDAIQDSTVITFVYLKDGAQLEFTSNEFPDDFDEDIYTFVKRYDKLIRKGNAEPPIKDFTLQTMDGADTTTQLLQQQEIFAFIFFKDHPDTDWLKHFDHLYNTLQQKQIKIFAVGNIIQDQIPNFKGYDNVHFLKGDIIPIKTAARSNPTLYILKNGTIQDKWSYADWDKAVTYLKTH